jgi:hypothetical protein
LHQVSFIRKKKAAETDLPQTRQSARIASQYYSTLNAGKINCNYTRREHDFITLTVYTFATAHTLG